MPPGVSRSLKRAATVRVLLATVAAMTAALLVSWLSRLGQSFGIFGITLVVLTILAALVAPRRVLLVFLAVAALLPILTAILRGPEFSWAEPFWLAASAGALLSAAVRPKSGESHPGVSAVGYGAFALWAIFSAAVAIAPDLPSRFPARLARHLIASAPTILDGTTVFFPVHTAVVIFESLLAILLGGIYLRDRGGRRLARRAFLLGATAVCGYALVEYFFHVKLWPLPHYDIMSGYRRVAATLPDPNALGSFLLLAIFLAAGARGEASGRKRDVYSALLVLFIFVLLLSGSRVAWGVGAATAVFLFLRGGRRKAWRAAVLVILLALAAAVALAPVRQRIELTAASSGSWHELFFGRLGFLRAGMRMVATHPLAGIGEGRYYRDLPLYKDAELWIDHENAHDYFLQVASETGLVGLGLFLSVLAMALARRRPEDCPGWRAALTAFLLTMLAGNALLLPVIGIVFFLLLASLPPGRNELRRRVPLAAGILVLAVVVWGGIRLREAFKQPSRFHGYGISPVAEVGGPGGRPQFWTDDLFAVPANAAIFISEPNALYSGRTRVKEVGAGRVWRAGSGWTMIPPGGGIGGWRWFSSAALWCPQNIDPESGDRRLLSLRISGQGLP